MHSNQTGNTSLSETVQKNMKNVFVVLQNLIFVSDGHTAKTRIYEKPEVNHADELI